MEQGSGAFHRATARDAAVNTEEGSDKPRYRRYQYDLIAPYCGRTVLEVGAGLGEFAALFTDRERVVVTDVDHEAVEVMRQRFHDRPEIEVRRLDADGGVQVDEPVHSVVAINVLEHFDDDVSMLRSLARLVLPGGSIVVWVPGYQALYGEFDQRVGHFRRYSPATLRSAAWQAGLHQDVVRPVNLLGGLAWWLAVRTGGAGSPDTRLVGIYDQVVVPVSRALDRWLRVPFGQSVLGAFRVPATAGRPDGRSLG